MADAKWSAKSVLSGAPLHSDQLLIIDDPGGTPLSRKVTTKNFLQGGFGENVLHYGAVGNGSTDDTAAINAAYAAANASGGYPAVIFPGKRAYKITSTIVMPSGVHTIGIGGSDNANDGIPPRILWGGSAGGTMFDVNNPSTFELTFRNIYFAGSATNDPAHAIRFRGAPIDSGTVFHDCWFYQINGDAIWIDGVSCTNFRISGGRFDNIYGGYAIYADVSTGAYFHCTIDGNVTYVGGANPQGKGFLFINGEGTSGGYSHVNIQGLHTEKNTDFIETYAAGVYPSDRQGMIRLGVNPGGAGMQHQISVTDLNHSYTGNSHCVFQITATSGTAANAMRCAFVGIYGGSGLNAFGTADSATTGEVRMFGGLIPDDQRFPFLGYRIGLILWGYGRNSSYEAVRHFINSEDFRVRGLKIHPESGTVAPGLYSGTATPSGSVSAPKGSLYIDTDATSTTTRLYINTDGGTTWATFTSSA
jgi:hypothetical protein